MEDPFHSLPSSSNGHKSLRRREFVSSSPFRFFIYCFACCWVWAKITTYFRLGFHSIDQMANAVLTIDDFPDHRKAMIPKNFRSWFSSSRKISLWNPPNGALR